MNKKAINTLAGAAAMAVGVVATKLAYKLFRKLIVKIDLKRSSWDNDQPLIVLGGSLKLQNRKRVAWLVGEESATHFAFARFLALRPPESADFSCNGVSFPSNMTGPPAWIKIRYADPNGPGVQIVVFRDAIVDRLLELLVFHPGETSSYPESFIRQFITPPPIPPPGSDPDTSDNPHPCWKATSITSSGWDPPIRCDSIPDGVFSLTVHSHRPGIGLIL